MTINIDKAAPQTAWSENVQTQIEFELNKYHFLLNVLAWVH